MLEIWQQAPNLATHIIPTASSILGGLLAALLLGIPTGLLMGTSSRVYRRTSALLSLLSRLPLIALAPLVVVWFGFGGIPNLLVPFLLCLPLVMTSVAEGSRSLSPEFVAFMDTTGATSALKLVKVRLPASLPCLLVAVRSAISWAVAGALVVELLGSDRGLGFLLMGATAKFNTPLIFAVITLLSALGALLYLSVRTAETILIPWHREVERVK
jgi:NitT/TauT family transport system permease protein